MDLQKISLLCLMILSAYVRESESNQFHKVTYKRSSNVKKELRSLSASECYCYPKNPQGKRISEHVSPNAEIQGRLVVYLFKDINGKITLYVPNEQKQRLLPDLTFDVGDKLTTITKEKISDVYNIYSDDTSNTNVNDFTWQKIPDGSSPLDIYFPPQYLDEEALKALIAKFNNYKSYNFNNVDKNFLLHFINKNPTINNQVLVTDVTPETGKKYADINDLILPGDLKVESKEPKPIEIIETLNTSKITKDIPKKTPMRPNAPEHITIQFPPKVPENIEFQNKPSQNDYVPSNLQIQYKPIDIHKPTPQDQIVPDGKFMYVIDGTSGKYTPYTKNLNIALDPLIIKEIWSYVLKPSIDGTLTVTRPAQKVDSEIVLSPPKYNSGKKVYFILPDNELNEGIEFQEWWKKQEQFIERRTKFSSRDIYESGLKLLVLGYLLEKGIKLNHAGHLLNSNGKILDMTKLKLILTVVADDGVEYNKVSTGKQPFDYSSLSVIIVNLSNPPNVIGVIDLGRMVLETNQPPKKKPNVEEIKPPAKKKEITIKEIIIPSKKEIKITKPICKSQKSKKNNCGKAIHFQKVKVLKKEKKKKVKGNCAKKPKSLLGKFSRIADVESENPNVNGVLIEDKLASIEIPEEVVIGDVEDNNPLGIRIIGGQAATSSGTPVKVKGRSGYDYYY